MFSEKTNFAKIGETVSLINHFIQKRLENLLTCLSPGWINGYTQILLQFQGSYILEQHETRRDLTSPHLTWFLLHSEKYQKPIKYRRDNWLKEMLAKQWRYSKVSLLGFTIHTHTHTHTQITPHAHPLNKHQVTNSVKHENRQVSQSIKIAYN